jgi:hypothetical protein
VCYHPNVAGRERGVGLDAFDERRAAWGVSKAAFDQHDLGTPVGDGIECAQRIGILECARLAQEAARLESWQVCGGADDDRGGHSLRV